MTKRLSEIMTRDTEPHLIPSTLHGTLIAAMRKRLVGTQLLALRLGSSSIKGASIDIVTEDRDSADVHVIGEGQEIPIDLMATSTFNMKPVKYGYRPVITKEMQEDGNWDMIQRNLELAGYKMADTLDKLILTEINTGAALTEDDNGATRSANSVTGSSPITPTNISDAIKLLEANNYQATDFLIDSNQAADIRTTDSFVEADKAGVTDPSKRLIGTIYGMYVWQTNNLPTANYSYVIDKAHALVLAEKRPITIEKYDDVTRDLSGVVITARWKARYLRPDACARITSS